MKPHGLDLQSSVRLIQQCEVRDFPLHNSLNSTRSCLNLTDARRGRAPVHRHVQRFRQTEHQPRGTVL